MIMIEILRDARMILFSVKNITPQNTPSGAHNTYRTPRSHTALSEEVPSDHYLTHHPETNLAAQLKNLVAG